MPAGLPSRFRTSWRYLVPTAAAGVVAVIASGVLSAQADPSLPPRSAAQLLADLRTVDLRAFSGTVVQKTSLGLPELPVGASGGGSLSLMSLLSGTNTLRVWYDGPSRQRLALLDPTGEMDVFHNGTDVWQWDSSNRTASRMTAPSATPESSSSLAGTPGALSPDVLAQQALAAIGPTTEVRVETTTRVAKRSVYRLVLVPRDSATRVGSVTIEIDGATKIPLGVQIYAQGANSPAVDVSFTSISFTTPDAANFSFTPPAGSTVTNADPAPAGPDRHYSADGGGTSPTVTGTGWTQVVVLHASAAATNASNEFSSMLRPVSGTWGSGRLLTSSLLSVLVLPDGRVLVGAVQPERLFSAVGP